MGIPVTLLWELIKAENRFCKQNSLQSHPNKSSIAAPNTGQDNSDHPSQAAVRTHNPGGEKHKLENAL